MVCPWKSRRFVFAACLSHILSVQEAADALGIARATADRYWAYARTWLYCELHGTDGPPPPEQES